MPIVSCRLSSAIKVSLCRQKKRRKGLKGAFAKAQEDRIYNREAPPSSVKVFLPDQNPSINKSCKIEYGQSLRYLTWVDQVPKIGKKPLQDKD